MRRIAVGFDECGTEIQIEIGQLVDIDRLRRKYPECSFNEIKTEDIDHWHNMNTGDQDDY